MTSSCLKQHGSNIGRCPEILWWDSLSSAHVTLVFPLTSPLPCLHAYIIIIIIVPHFADFYWCMDCAMAPTQNQQQAPLLHKWWNYISVCLYIALRIHSDLVSILRVLKKLCSNYLNFDWTFANTLVCFCKKYQIYNRFCSSKAWLW